MRIKVSPWVLLVLVALAWRAIYAYWTPLVNKYIVPPGDDPAAHTAYVADLLDGRWQLFDGGYPLGFHLLTALLAKIANWDALTAINLVTPLLLVLPIPLLFLVGRQIFKSTIAGTFAALVWSFLALVPVRAFGDGNYPNMLGGSILVPLTLLSFWSFFQRPSRQSLLFVLMSFLAVLLVHHLSLVYVIAAGLPFLLWGGSTLLQRFRRERRLFRAAAGAALLVTVLAAAVWISYGRTLIAPYLATLRTEGTLAGFFGGQSVPLTWTQLLELHNPLLVALGITGAFLMLIATMNRATKVLLIGWIIMLWLLSTTSMFGLPERFARELAIPFALTGGFFLSFFIEQAKTHASSALLLILALTLLFLDWQASFNRPFALPDPYKPLIRVQHEEEFALQTLRDTAPPGTTILANNSNPYLPFLVPTRVVIATEPADVDQALASEPVSLLFLGSRPPLTPEDIYPFYARYDSIRVRLLAIPNKELIEALPAGTEIYRLTSDVAR